MYGSIKGDSSDARAAYEQKDPDLSRTIHDGRISMSKSQLAQENHTKHSELLKSAVYGATDGVLTAFAIVSGGAGGSLQPGVVLLLGLSSLFANAVSMGFGDVISSLSYREHVLEERRREEWEFDTYPEGEIKEMVDMYDARGLPREKAEVVIATMAKYKDFFLDLMVTEELGLKIPSMQDDPYKGGLVTSCAFIIFGSFPLLAYVIFMGKTSEHTLVYLSTFATLLALFILGAVKSRFTDHTWWKSGLEYCVLGGMVALVAYLIGEIVANVTNDAAAAVGN